MGKRYDLLLENYKAVELEVYELRQEAASLRQQLKEATFKFEPYVSPREGQLELALEQANREKDRLIEYAKAMNLDAAVNRVIAAIKEANYKAPSLPAPMPVYDVWLKTRNLTPTLPLPGEQPPYPDTSFCFDCEDDPDDCCRHSTWDEIPHLMRFHT